MYESSPCLSFIFPLPLLSTGSYIKSRMIRVDRFGSAGKWCYLCSASNCDLSRIFVVFSVPISCHAFQILWLPYRYIGTYCGCGDKLQGNPRKFGAKQKVHLMRFAVSAVLDKLVGQPERIVFGRAISSGGHLRRPVLPIGSETCYNPSNG